MKNLQQIGDIRGTVIFVRCDFNVPVTDGRIDDDYRIRKALPTINVLRDKGAKLVLASHIETEGAPTLKPVHEYLEKIFPVKFESDYFPADIRPEIDALPEGGVILLENLRKYPEEKANDERFAKHLASFADIYVDDAFATAHRAHASIVGIPKFIPGFAGNLLADEIEHLSSAFNAPHPFVFILGGAKFDTKLPLVRKFLPLADTIYVCGALSNDIFKVKGYNVGLSKLSEGADVADLAANPKIVVPSDVVVSNEFGKQTKAANEVADGDNILDAGEKALADLRGIISSAKFILWNGPLGNFEIGFREGTVELAKIIAEASERGAGSGISIVGGGDTLSAISSLGIEDKFTFVSTGGGAMLDFLANGSLPGVEALG